MVCIMARFNSSPKTPTKVKVAKRPAPEDNEPENIPTQNKSSVPTTTLVVERFSSVLLPKPFLNNV